MGVAGCSGSTGSNLEITDRRYTYDQGAGYGTEYLTVENSGDTTNVRAYVDLVSTEGENEGEVLETYDRTGIIEGGGSGEIAVEMAHYLSGYERSVGVEPTDRPHATFEVVSEGVPVRADGSESGSVESSIASYEWSAHQDERPGYGESLNWGISGGETVEFEWQNSEELLIDLVLKVTDEEGRTDEYNSWAGGPE